MARQATLVLYSCFKFIELILQIGWTGLMCGSGFWLVDKIREQTIVLDEDRTLMYMVGVSLVLTIYQLFYSTLLINLRFNVKMKCVTAGLCMFDCVNFLFCYCCLKKICKNNNWIFVLLKWVLQIGVMAFTYTLVKAKQDRWEEEFEVGTLVRGTTRFDMYLIVYMAQVPFFQVLRIPFFLCASLFTCCCDFWDKPLADNFEMEQMIWNYEFVEYELGLLNNFEHHPVGRAEFAFNRELAMVRQNTNRLRQEEIAAQAPADQQLAQSNLRMQATQTFHRLGGTIYQKMSRSQRGECVFCYMEMCPGDKIIVLQCHESHKFHITCYENFVDHFERSGTPLLCPLCRTPIAKDQVTKKVIQKEEQNNLNVHDAFGLSPRNGGNVAAKAPMDDLAQNHSGQFLAVNGADQSPGNVNGTIDPNHVVMAPVGGEPMIHQANQMPQAMPPQAYGVPQAMPPQAYGVPQAMPPQAYGMQQPQAYGMQQPQANGMQQPMGDGMQAQNMPPINNNSNQIHQA